jgi:hypothetical protein
MSRAAVAIAVAIGLAAAAAAAWWVLTHPASRTTGETITERVAMQPFRQITLDGDAEVTLVQGDAEAVAIDVSGRSIVHAAVEDGVLRIRSANDRRWWSYLVSGAGAPPHVTVTFRSLDSLRASGAVRLAAERLHADTLTFRFSGAAKVHIGALDAKSLAITGSGAFKADVAGRVDEQRISISGAGDYDAVDLASDKASISVSGAGRVVVFARQKLDVELSGAAKVDYKGDPKVTERVSGAGRVRRLEGDRASRGDPNVSAASARRTGSYPA